MTVPRLEMASRGWVDDGEFTVSSRISMDLSLTGGYKYSFLLGFSLEAPDIAKAFAYRNYKLPYLDPVNGPDADELLDVMVEKQNNQAFIGFRVARATVQRVFDLPLELSYFIGSGDDFCSGDDFSLRFGHAPFGTDFKGFFYFPEGIGGNLTRQYNGVHGARGTGLSFALTMFDNIVPMLYIYQDSAFFPEFVSGGNTIETLYSGDLRLLLNWNWLRLEAFGGASCNPDLDFNFRGGVMGYLAGNGVELFAQAGIPRWDWKGKFSVDNMYFLIEPRLRFAYFGVNVTFFYHPVVYLHVVEEKERGRADFNVKFLFGNIDSGFAGGVETGGELKIGGKDDFVFRVSPFASFVSAGLLWDVKLRIRPVDYDTPKEMFDIFIGVRTAF